MERSLRLVALLSWFWSSAFVLGRLGASPSAVPTLSLPLLSRAPSDLRLCSLFVLHDSASVCKLAVGAWRINIAAAGNDVRARKSRCCELTCLGLREARGRRTILLQGSASYRSASTIAALVTNVAVATGLQVATQPVLVSESAVLVSERVAGETWADLPPALNWVVFVSALASRWALQT